MTFPALRLPAAPIGAAVLLAACALLPARAEPPDGDRAARLQVLRGYMETDLALFEKGLLAPKPEPVTRDLAAAALAHVMLSNDVAGAQALLEPVFAMQEMDPASPGYGDVAWQQNHPEIKDPNAIQFTTLSLAPLFIRYDALFPDEFRAKARAHLRGALAALRKKPVPVAYTNIFLMKLANTVLLGEYLGDAESVAAGKAALEEWLRFTRENGVTEYDSAVYTGVQLAVLHTLDNTVRDPGIKALADVALEYLWTDAAANYFPGAQAMSGSSSRTYSFLFHDLNVNQFYYLYGFQPDAPGRIYELSAEVLGWANGTWASSGASAYEPPARLRDLSREPVRVVRQRTGPGPGQDRTNYITPAFSLGSSSAFYEHQDREIALLFNSPKPLPAVSVVLDPFNSPYGKVRILESKGGFHKIFHLRNSIAAVQQEGAVLALLELAAEAGKKIGGSVATNIVFPLGTDGLYLDGKPVAWDREAIPVSAGSVVGLREGRAAVALRLFAADGAMDGCPVFFLRNDGGVEKAARLVAYHSRGNDGLRPVQELRSGVLILAAECADDAAFAAFFAAAQAWKVSDREEAGIWQATASGPAISRAGGTTSLSASLDIAARAVAARSVDGRKYEAAVFSVNGRDLAGEIWKRVAGLLAPPSSPALQP